MTKTLSSRERVSPQEKMPVDLFSSQQSSDESSETTKKSVAQSPMQPPIVELQVVHATTGRVRIRATDGSHNSIFETISGQLRKQNGVREVSVNEQTGSLVVNFDEKKLPLPQILERLQQFNIHQLQASPEAKSKKDPFAAWKSPDFWKEQGISFIPLFTGLAVTGGLGISGLASIPVYYVTANATRRVIDELQSESKTSAVSCSQKAKDKNKSSTKPNTTDHPSLSKSKSKVEHKSIETAAGPAKIAYSVVHAIPGRIRLNVPRVARDRAYARRLERLLKTEPQVTNVRVNCDAASIAITYGSAQIPVSHWVGLMQLADKTIPETNLIKIEDQQLTQPVHQQGEPTTSTEQTKPIKTTIEQALTQPVNLSEPTTSTTLKEQAVVETDGLWSDFKSPALFTALSFMANFPLDPVPY
ncbi:heavy metal translocating P-type ATPase [Scytonema tolypothrichoides VB-61278]|nr:heavy metal translocating P-type ATPase [Scytonema tolypothrichoides VB-61278]